MDKVDGSRARPLVLVVDDDEGVRGALERSLKAIGYDVLIAVDGADGFEQALRAEPAVVLADVHMPGMNGHALLRRLTHAGVQASVILMSGQGELDDAIGALREGAVDYLKKPWTMRELTTVLERAMGLVGALRELSLPAARGGASGPARDADAEVVDASALVEEIAERAARGQMVLPLVRPPMARLRKNAGDGDPSAEMVGAFSDRDPRLSLAVLRMAGGANEHEPPLGDIRAFIASLEVSTVHAAAETLALREAFPIRVAPLRILNDRIWRFSVARALAMQGIADLAELESPIDRQDCYLAGLLLDIGASYLLSMIAEAMERRGSGISDAAQMTAAVAAHHSHLGASVLHQWGFSPEWEALLAGHHGDPSSSPDPLWCATALGGAVAVRVAGFGDPTGDRNLRPESLARCAYTLGVGDTVLRRLTKSLTDNANQLWAACA
jgi:DNA-binding response OmpR family regulator